MHHKQLGYGLPAYRGVVMQRGYGLGGLSRGLMRAVTPHIKQGLKQVGKRALQTGLQVMSDVSEGKNLKSSLKERALENATKFIQQPFKKRKTSPKPIRGKASRGKGRRGRPSTTLGIL